MGLRLRIFLGMMTLVVCALLATGYVAYRFGADAEQAYNDQRLLRKEAALQRSLSYMLERMGGEVSQDSLALVFTDRICELADVHSLKFSLYNQDGRLVTTSDPAVESVSQVALVLSDDVLAEARDGRKRTVLPDRATGTAVVWPLTTEQGELLALGHVHYDPRMTAEADWRVFLGRLAPVYLMLFLLVGLVAFSLSNSIVRPLRGLAEDMASNPLDRGQGVVLESRWKDEVGTLVQSYNSLLEQLQESMESRALLEREGAWREMAQQVAHEIKNPLTPMRLGAQHLERAWADGAGDFAERLKRYTNTTVQQIDALSHIAEGFALLATDGAVEPQQVELGALLEDVTGLHAEPHVTWSREEGAEAWVWADKTRLVRAFNNLIQNALESKSDGAVDVSVALRVQGNVASVTVSDNGDGIDVERMARIFEPKFTTKTHGLGLGLAMVRAIVQGAKGEVTVQSKEREGTEFEVRLPCVTPRGAGQVG
jgi:signal transduction histidine kinase